MTEQLKPCPFCGGEAYIEQPGTRRQSCIVECGSCGLRHDSGDEGDRCGTSWNRRALESRLLAESKYTQADMEHYGKCYADARDKRLGCVTHPTPDDASETYREVGVWDTDGRKFRTYAAENLNGKAMYVRDAAMQADKETK